MSNEQDVGTRFIASSNHKLIEISPAIHEPDAHSYRVGAGLAPALEATSAPGPALETVFTPNAPTCELDAETGIAFVTVQDKTEEVDITLVEDVVPGDWLLVHGGVAIANVENHSPNGAGEASDA